MLSLLALSAQYEKHLELSSQWKAAWSDIDRCKQGLTTEQREHMNDCILSLVELYQQYFYGQGLRDGANISDFLTGGDGLE